MDSACEMSSARCQFPSYELQVFQTSSENGNHHSNLKSVPLKRECKSRLYSVGALQQARHYRRAAHLTL